MPQQQVQMKINLTIAVEPMVVNPSTITLPVQYVGVPAVIPLNQVEGGTKPYQQPTLDPKSPSPLPPGMEVTIDQMGNVVLSGTPTSPGSGTFMINIKDSGA